MTQTLLSLYKKINVVPDLKNNAFDFVRIILSLMVVLAHCAFPTIGAISLNVTGGVNIGMYGVYGFFLISGYLLSFSLNKNNDLFNFFKNRALRIYPGFLFMLFIIATVFVPFWYYIAFGQNWLDPKNLLNMFYNSFSYFFKNIGGEIMMPYLEIASKNNGSFTEVNISLWSIIQEIRAYVIIFLLFVLGIVHNKKLFNIGFVVSSLVFCMIQINPVVKDFFATLSSNIDFLFPFFYFILGIFFWVNKDWIKFELKYFIFSIVALLLLINFNFVPFFGYILFGYCLLFLCYKLPIQNLSKKYGDYTYGLYLYSFPVQITLFKFQIFQKYGFLTFYISTLLISFVFAFLSWHLVEKKFLRRRIPKPIS